MAYYRKYTANTIKIELIFRLFVFLRYNTALKEIHFVIGVR